MAIKISILLIAIVLNCVFCQFNPSILQDARQEPKLDGTFGFLYRTEDGIAHAAKADPGGVVHGRFSYTDPTGLIVNFNYNAGSGVTPKYNYDAPIQTSSQQQQQQQAYQPQAQQAPAYQPQQQQAYQPQAQRAPVYQPQHQQAYQQPQQYEERRTKPPALRNNNYNQNNENGNYNDAYDNNVNNYDSNQYY